MKRKYIIVLSISCMLLIIAGGLYLPEFLLKTSADRIADQLQKVPVEYEQYASSTASKIASLQLSEYEKIRLISNSWSSATKLIASQTEQSQFSIVETAKENLNQLYQCQLYPTDFSKMGDSWYTWDIKCYSSTDTTFHTYTADSWVITLKKYDHSETHTVLMTEDGTILFAEASVPDTQVPMKDITVNYKEFPYVKNKLSSCTRLSPKTALPYYDHVNDPTARTHVGVITIGNEWISDEATLKKYYDMNTSEYEFYYLYQTNETSSDTLHYVIGMIPYKTDP